MTKGVDLQGRPMVSPNGSPSADAQRFMKDKGAAWGEAKRREQVVLAHLKSKADAVTVTAHLRTKYIGSAPSTSKEPRAKETVYQFVSLFLVLQRVEKQAAPAAIVLKSTLMDKKAFLNGELKPVLPPRLPVADWATIWGYIENPADMENLKPEEVATGMSEEEELRLLAKIAESGETN